ncbi:MAG: hypothetical protein Aureis2KO_01510 [Aureisphaera sp.]
MSQKNTEFSKLKQSIGKILLAKESITLEELNLGKGFSIYGLHQGKINYENPRKGIYGISTGTHNPVNLFIYEESKIVFLDITSFEELLISLREVLEYSFKKNYCLEVTNDYIFRLIRLHYNINRNPKSRLDINCKLPKRTLKSIYNLMDLKLELAEELVTLGKIENINVFLDNTVSLALQKLGMYYGNVDLDNKLDIGIYNYTIINTEQKTNKYFVLNEGHYRLLKLDNPEDYIKTLQEIVLFGEDNNICSEKIIWLIEKISNDFLANSCFKTSVKDLP